MHKYPKKGNCLTLSLRQQGNSIGLTVPKAYLDALELVKGSQVDLELKGDSIEMRPHKEVIGIEELMEQYDPELHNYDDLIPGEIGRERIEEE